ncbi:MAG: hypothetical protein FJX52_16195, partial [Alphaproteobacteria bacterium]|nr:hypothetical protein [Alphaproteobacteria bacterium]
MDKRFLIAWAVVFAAWMAGDFLVHGVLLHADYAYLPSLFRPEAEGHKFIHLMVLAHVIMAGAFVWMYGRGVETKSWPAQGARYGLAVVLLTTVPTYTIYYVVQPMPGGWWSSRSCSRV